MIKFRMMTTGAPRLSGVNIVRQLDTLSTKGWDVDFAVMKGSCVTTLNTMMDEASNADFFIFAHDDISIPDATILERLPQHDLPVVDCPLPGYASGALHYLAFQLTPDGEAYSETRGRGVQPIYSSQLGLTCFRHDVLNNEAMRPFWGLGNDQPMGTDDHMLCRRLHENDIPIVADWDIDVDHAVKVRAGLLMRNGVCEMGLDASKLNLPVCSAYREFQKTMKG